MIEALREGKLKIVSDNSYDKGHRLGSAAWIIATSRENYLTNRNWTSGEASVQEGSHQSELLGLLGAIMQMNRMCKRFYME